jgi:hypothetical protein
LSIFIFQPISDQQNFENFSEINNLNESSKNFLSDPVNAKYRVAVYTTKSWNRL